MKEQNPSLREPTGRSPMPQGTMCLKCSRFGRTLRDRPCIVIHLFTRTPTAYAATGQQQHQQQHQQKHEKTDSRHPNGKINKTKQNKTKKKKKKKRKKKRKKKQKKKQSKIK